MCKVIHVHGEQLGETTISKHSQHFATLSRKCHYVVQNVVLAVVLKGCDNVLLHSSRMYRTMFSASKHLMSCEERRLRVFENRVLGRVFGPTGDEVTVE